MKLIQECRGSLEEAAGAAQQERNLDAFQQIYNAVSFLADAVEAQAKKS